MERTDMPEIARRLLRKRRKGRGGKNVDIPMSGRCDGWVYYVVRGKQRRRRYFVPNDPRTPAQLRCRAAFSAASREWSHNQDMTNEERQECRVAGAKVRSRPRLGLWGWLTGQQYHVRRRCGKAEGRGQEAVRGKCESRRPKAEGSAKSETRGPKGLGRAGGLRSAGRVGRSRSTWEQYRIGSVAGPWQVRGSAGRRMCSAEWRMENGGEADGRWRWRRRERWRGS